MQFRISYFGPDSWLLTDNELMSVLQAQSVGEPQYVGELARRLRTGDLFEPLVLWRTSRLDKYGELSSVDFKRGLEKQISEVIHCRCIFHVILDKGKTQRALDLVLREDGAVHRIGASTQEVLIGVFLSRPEKSPTSRRTAINLLSARLGLAEHELSEIEDPVLVRNSSHEQQPELF